MQMVLLTLRNRQDRDVAVANFHFPLCKSMETLSCHSKESSWTLKIKKKRNITFVEGNVISKYAKFQLHPPYGF